ncbi:MAG: cell filamentation protein Fic [Verrucomicrobia bacterium]|nr:cell filamentation protein Fic [Verrucomicrobiota bacterium]
MMNSKLKEVGYNWLAKKYEIQALPHFIEAFIGEKSSRLSVSTFPIQKEFFPESYWPGNGDFDHLTFALRYEGLNLPLLRVLFPLLALDAVEKFIQTSPTGTYARKIWFLYENLTSKKCAISNATQGNYVDLIDKKFYYTSPGIRSPRHRVNMNLLGTLNFSPMIRRTPALLEWENKNLEKQCRDFLKSIPDKIYDRALRFLYTSETKSSYAIERETPDRKRSERFVEALREAGKENYLAKAALVSLQKKIVDPRFANNDYRDAIQEQNYVGTTIRLQEEKVHFISPKPENISSLMVDFLEASHRILKSEAHPVVIAAAIAYPFVFLHPFSDGNGRIHRFLIHYVFSSLGFAPEGVIFPVSAAMLHQPKRYDASLESFSSIVMPFIEYDLDEKGGLTVLNETADLYRYIDCTFIAETLFSFVEETIEREFPAEVHFIESYDQARQEMREIVDLPNRHADLFIRLCLQNHGHLSKTKQALSEFSSLTEDEIKKLETCVAMAFHLSVKQ